MAEGRAVTVCVRLRPLIARESEDLEDKVPISWESEGSNVSQVDGTKSFVFDRVFHSNDNTEEVFQGVAAPIIKSAVQGYNGTIFAYGQTASGKTYTMLGTKESPGILPLAIHDVFNTICKIPTREFLLRISYMEIHNENIQDLLCSNFRKKKPLVVREDINRTIYVEDLSEEVVISPEQVLKWLQKGEENRHYGETKMNKRSSRSHTIFRMIIESKERTDASSSSCDGAVMVSHLNLVDLAGSERASQAGAEGIRLKEGCNINRSLFILGQVIKKLCDDQSGNAFINYRDSKLTRILQNSLGGNAKTVIICTITPVSLEETLSTLQFASTAKKMKNTPKVNEVVVDDDALLKRYRKEIEDLKRQLEEVSSFTHTKDQLAQLLEEKNSLQKEQQDRIRALSEMLVTASSCSKEKESKVRRKRRVTWAPGVINQNESLCFLGHPPVKRKHFISSFCSLPEMEESACSELSEYDDQGMTTGVTLPDEEWVPGSEINFCNAVTEQQTLKAKLENLQLENEQLRCELTELREKMATDEFVTLENKTAKEYEMQLMHENSNLKEEIKLKDVQLKEQKDKIEVLENNVTELKRQVEEFKAESGKREVSSMQMSNKEMDEVQRLNQSLRDAETVALDAKKDLSIFRSENIALKEKMTQLSDTYNQMEKDLECCRSQLEAEKVTYRKMQSDLQKELQWYFQENAKLTSLLEGKFPKELLSSVELERKIEDLKNELTKAMEENITLRKESTMLAQAASGPDPKIFQNEILEKSELIASLTSEKDSLLSQVMEKERLLQEMTDALHSKDDLANAEKMREKDTEFQELKHQNDELKQKLLTTSEESKQMKGQVDLLSDENLKLNVTIHDLTKELSLKVQELQEKRKELETLHGMKEQFDGSLWRQNLVDQLEEELKAKKMEMSQRLWDSEEKMKSLIQERNDLEQKMEAVQTERDAFRALEDKTSLKMQQLIEESSDLKKLLDLREKQSQQVEERLNELQRLKVTPESRITVVEQEKTELDERFRNTMESMRSLTQENESLKTTLQTLQTKEEDMIKTIHRLSESIAQTVAANLKLQEQLREAHSSMKETESLRGKIMDKDSTMKQMFEEKERLRAQVNTNEEQLKESLNLDTSEKDQLVAKLKDQTERVQQLMKEASLLQKERDDLQQAVQSITAENDQLQGKVLELTAKFSKTNANVEKQGNIESLESKVLRLKEVLKQFPVLENRSECFKNTSLQIKRELDNQKSLLAKVLVDLSPVRGSRPKMLHMEHEFISNGLHSILNKVQFLFTRLCKKKTEYYTNISTYTAVLLDERRKQRELQIHIRGLRKPCLEESQGFASQEVNVAQLSHDLDRYKEQILKDISGLEEELLSIEEQLQKMKSDGEEVKQHVGRCLANFDIQDFEAGIKQYNEILMPVGRFLKSKSQAYIQARSEVETKMAEYYKESECAVKECQEETKKLFLELNTLQDEQKSCVSNLALEEENYKLQNKLQATDLKKLELKIQELENEANEAERNRQEMEKRTYTLQTQLKARIPKSEVVRLQAALEEKENCLTRALAERETLKAQIDRGAEPYKEEIEDLKTQLVKADLAQMKQSKFFQQELANAKALAEHKEEQLRKLMEKLHQAQQEQDVTVKAIEDLPQTLVPITCGGGSGIVQNTQVMVVKMEHVKLEKTYNQLKKEYDLMLATDLALKEEVKKWKERALKKREQSLRSTDEEQRLKFPRKTAPAFFPGLPCSPSRESSLKPVCPLDTPPAAGFFADPRQGNSTEKRHEGAESSEMNLKQWIASTDKDGAKNCNTQ